MLVGEAYNVESVLQLSASQPVDVVVMDIRMPHICGMSTVRRILEDYPHAKIVLVSMQSDIRYVQENIRAGVSGYVLKDCVYEELVEAVHIASAGGQFISPEIENDIP